MPIVIRGGIRRRPEEARRRPLAGPELELPFRLRDEHLDAADREAAFLAGAADERRDRRGVDQVEHDLAVEPPGLHVADAQASSNAGSNTGDAS